MEVRLDINQLENGKYNLISGSFNKISKRFICVYNDVCSPVSSGLEKLQRLGLETGFGVAVCGKSKGPELDP